MRIACFDKTAGGRENLAHFIETCFQECRNFVGHFPIELVPLTGSELSFGKSFDVAVIGPEFTPEEGLSVTQKIAQANVSKPVIVFLSADNHTIRNLSRFDSYTEDVFTYSSEAARIVHRISKAGLNNKEESAGSLFVVSGVKGGVGTTSIVGGLSHAAHSQGKTSVIVDLSKGGVLATYFGSKKRHSAEFSAALIDRIRLDRQSVTKMLVEVENGLSLFLPPESDDGLRDLWLRSQDTLETSLDAIAILQEIFDVVIVDSDHAEGLLPYALLSRADRIVLVSSNEPAAVHLLGKSVEEIQTLPGSKQAAVILNMLSETGLSLQDTREYLEILDSASTSLIGSAIPYDSRGRLWIGTGNTIYTESGKSFQRSLEDCLQYLLNDQRSLSTERQHSEKRLKTFIPPSIGNVFKGLKDKFSSSKVGSEDILKPPPFAGFIEGPPEEHFESGNISLEFLLLIAATVTFSFSTVAVFFSHLEEYSSRYAIEYSDTNKTGETK